MAARCYWLLAVALFRQAYAELRRMWRSADAGLAELEEVTKNSP